MTNPIYAGDVPNGRIYSTDYELVADHAGEDATTITSAEFDGYLVDPAPPSALALVQERKACGEYHPLPCGLDVECTEVDT